MRIFGAGMWKVLNFLVCYLAMSTYRMSTAFLQPLLPQLHCPVGEREKDHIVLLTSPYPFKMLDLVLGTSLTNLGFGVLSRRSKEHFKKAGTLNP